MFGDHFSDRGYNAIQAVSGVNLFFSEVLGGTASWLTWHPVPGGTLHTAMPRKALRGRCCSAASSSSSSCRGI